MQQPSRRRTSYDSLWRALPEEVILSLVHLFVPTITAPLTPRKTDLAVVTEREIDGSFLVEVDGAPLLLHLEYQNYLDPTIPRRMHEYASILEQQYFQQYQAEITVAPIVIWAVAGTTPSPVYHREQFGKVFCHREYFEVHLSQLDWHSVDPLLLVLAPYLQGVRREDLETIALRLYAAASSAQQDALLGASLALSERKFADFAEIEQAILQKVRKQMDEILKAIEESSFGVAILEKGEALGIQKGEALGIQKGEALGIQKGEALGIQKGEALGIQKGEALGKVEGLTSAIQILWQTHFGVMPTEVATALRGLSEQQMQDLLAFLAQTPSEADVRAWLKV